MSYLVRSMLVIAGASLFAAAGVEPPPDVLSQVVIVNGPHAGTYKTPGSELICMRARQHHIYAATWTNLDEVVKDLYGVDGNNKPDDASEMALNIASISVSNPDDPGAKQGDVNVALVDRGKKQISYKVDAVPLSLTIKGEGAEISFEGKTKDGIQLRVTAKCSKMEEM